MLIDWALGGVVVQWGYSSILIPSHSAKGRQFESPSLLFFRRSDGFATLAGDQNATQLRDESFVPSRENAVPTDGGKSGEK